MKLFPRQVVNKNITKACVGSFITLFGIDFKTISRNDGAKIEFNYFENKKIENPKARKPQS